MLLFITFNYLLVQNACDIKNDRKDNIFNTPATLEEYINFTIKAVEESKDGLHF